MSKHKVEMAGKVNIPTKKILCTSLRGAPACRAGRQQRSNLKVGDCFASLAMTVSFLSVFSLYVYAEELPPLPEGPLLLTSITPEQLNADYWINRLPNPDQVLKTPEELAFFNQEILKMAPARVDVLSWPAARRGKDIRDQLELEYTTVAGRILYDTDGKRIPKDFFAVNVKPFVQWETIPAQIRIKWGVATRAASIRALPTAVKMLEDVGDIEFDQLQFTLIKLWAPVAIFHQSKDGAWYYVQAPYVRGWVRARDIAVFKDLPALKQMTKRSRFLVVTGESVPVCLSLPCSAAGSSAANVYQNPSMGTVLPLIAKAEDAYHILMPFRSGDGSVLLKKAYVNAQADVRQGFPPFTQRNVIRQAFKLLGARYGWGGMYDGRDCSGFTHDVFLSMGVDMPRDSSDQDMVGTQLGHFEPHENAEGKIAALRKATPGITLMRMPLHLMLYIGEIDGKFYTIHSTWAERISMTSDEKRRINQVVVSDLSLNGNSYLGSLFDRIITINEVN